MIPFAYNNGNIGLGPSLFQNTPSFSGSGWTTTSTSALEATFLPSIVAKDVYGLGAVKVLPPSGSSSYAKAYYLVRRQGVTDYRYYGLGARGDTGSAVANIVKDWSTSLGATSAIGASSLVYNLRFQVVGTTLRVKMWQQGTTEPSDWSLSVTDSSYSSGYMGIGIVNQGTIYAASGYFYTSSPMTLTGQVTLNGSPVSGATVIAVRYGLSYDRPLVIGKDVVTAQTDSNGNYTLYFSQSDSGPWILSATAIIGGAYYASDARLINIT